MKVKIISAKSVAILEQRINKFLSEGKIIVRNIDMTKAEDKEYLCSSIASIMARLSFPQLQLAIYFILSLTHS